MLPQQILSANAKSLSSVSLFCSYLTNINYDSLPLFVSVFVISLMLEMPVKKFVTKTEHVWVSCLLGLALPPLLAVSFVIEISVVLTYIAHKVFIRKEAGFEYALKSTE